MHSLGKDYTKYVGDNGYLTHEVRHSPLRALHHNILLKLRTPSGPSRNLDSIPERGPVQRRVSFPG